MVDPGGKVDIVVEGGGNVDVVGITMPSPEELVQAPPARSSSPGASTSPVPRAKLSGQGQWEFVARDCALLAGAMMKTGISGHAAWPLLASHMSIITTQPASQQALALHLQVRNRVKFSVTTPRDCLLTFTRLLGRTRATWQMRWCGRRAWAHRPWSPARSRASSPCWLKASSAASVEASPATPPTRSFLFYSKKFLFVFFF